MTVYSNQQEVSLYQNGKKIDVKKGRHAFHFQVKLEQENHLEARSGDLKDEAGIGEKGRSVRNGGDYGREERNEKEKKRV